MDDEALLVRKYPACPAVAPVMAESSLTAVVDAVAIVGALTASAAPEQSMA